MGILHDPFGGLVLRLAFELVCSELAVDSVSFVASVLVTVLGMDVILRQTIAAGYSCQLVGGFVSLEAGEMCLGRIAAHGIVAVDQPVSFVPVMRQYWVLSWIVRFVVAVAVEPFVEEAQARSSSYPPLAYYLSVALIHRVGWLSSVTFAVAWSTDLQDWLQTAAAAAAAYVAIAGSTMIRNSGLDFEWCAVVVDFEGFLVFEDSHVLDFATLMALKVCSNSALQDFAAEVPVLSGQSTLRVGLAKVPVEVTDPVLP